MSKLVYRIFCGVLVGVGFCGWSRDLHAAPPIKLNGPLVAGGTVSSNGLQFSPDGSRVLYLADQTTDDVDEIFIVPSTGGTAIKLNGPLVANGDVNFLGFQFSPDGSRVLYLADQETGGVDEIFSVPSAGGEAVKLNGPLVLNGDVSGFGLQFSSDGSRVLYLADQSTDEVDEIFSVPSLGGVAVKLNGPLVANGDVNVNGLQFSPDGNRVLYLADQSIDEVDEIFSVPSAGGVVVRLNGPLVANGDVYFNGLQYSPDGSRVLYLADQTTNGVNELYIVSSVGGAGVKLNGPLVAGGNVSFGGFQFSPDGSRVLYLADQTTDEVNEIFSVPRAGGIPVKLNGPLVSGGDVSFGGFQFSPDGSRVLYRADQTTVGVTELFSVPSIGGVAVKLNGPLVAGGNVFSQQFSPDGSRVLYRADQMIDEAYEIFSVPSAGGVAVRLNGPLVANGAVFANGLQFSPDGSRVLYYAEQEFIGVNELYLVPSVGGTPVKLNGPLVAGGDVSSGGLQFSADGSLVLYNADQDTDGVFELYTRIVKQTWNGGSGSWNTGSNWQHGYAPDDVMQITVGTAADAILSGTTNQLVNELTIGGGGAGVTSIITLQAGSSITTIHGLTLKAGGVIRGDGQINSTFNSANLGSLRAGAGEQLLVNTPALTNSGRIEAIGTVNALAEVEISGTVTNTAGVGVISSRSGILRFNSGLTNPGGLTFSSGFNEVFGDITNTGVISVTGGAHTTFNDDVIQNGTLQVSKAGNTTSVAVFLGSFSGSGGSTGGGDIFFEGDVLPGNSPGRAEFDGSVGFGPASLLVMELAGTQPGINYDQLAALGDLGLGGALELRLLDGYTPRGGEIYDLLDWGSLNGQFQRIDLPPLAEGLSWNTTTLYSTGAISVIPEPSLLALVALVGMGMLGRRAKLI
ncbi:MAG: hypothetical protein SFX18_14060 [Pirellulales bacterium]|nr:hypothetical protein [Pirellulales bacterium]